MNNERRKVESKMIDYPLRGRGGGGGGVSMVKNGEMILW